MTAYIIFLPEFEYLSWNGSVYGVEYRNDTGIAVYMLKNALETDHRCKIVAEVGVDESNASTECRLFIKTCSRVGIRGVFVSGVSSSQVKVILYNRDHIERSQWLHRVRFSETDFILRLIREVKCESVQTVAPKSRRCLSFALDALRNALSMCRNRWVLPLIDISTFGLNFVNMLESATIILNEMVEGRRLRVPHINYISARLMDAVLGQIIIYYVMSYTSPNEMFLALTNLQEHVVIHLKSTLEWLMGSPAGFKLNTHLNNMLGPFYQFHISLWWTFLKLSKPMLKIIFKFFLFIGNFAFSFQVDILADLLAIVSVHMYCIYVYAARLYYFQMKGLKMLSHLVIGRKRNPLPGTENSPSYTTEQLLFGTVSFTILLFLLPTTLIYYCVFTTIRIILLIIGGILTRLRYFMNIFPLYITWLWLFDCVPLTSTVKLCSKMFYLPDGTVITRVKPVCLPWWKTVKMNVLESIAHPDDVEWKKLANDVLIGNLVYPV